MYGSVYYDKRKSKIHWCEYINDQRVEFSDHWVPDYFRETKDETEYKSESGKYLKRIVEQTFSKRRQAIKNCEVEVCGSDLPPELKFILEKWPQDILEAPTIKFLFFDIETECENGFPQEDLAEERINLITVWSNIHNKFFTWGLEKEFDLKTEFNSEYVCCDSEYELLDRFIQFNETDRHDIWSGWNSTRFDIPYIFNRILKVMDQIDPKYYEDLLKEKRNLQKDDVDYKRERIINDIRSVENKMYHVKRLSPYGVVSKSIKMKKDPLTKKMKMDTVYTIEGVADYDYIELDKQFRLGKRDSYKLDSVAYDELKETKLEYEGTIKEFYKRDWNNFVLYNIQDVNLLIKLNKKLNYIPQAIALSYKCHCRFEDNFGTTLKIESAVYNFLMKENVVLADKKVKEKGAVVPGGFVTKEEDLRRGLHKWIIDADVASLYPSVMRGLNISYDTCIGEIYVGEVCRETETSVFLGDVERHNLYAPEKIRGTIKKVLKEYPFEYKKEDVIVKNNLDGGKSGFVHVFKLNKNHPVVFKGKETTAEKIIRFIKKNEFSISARNIMFESKKKKKGVLVKILDMWYAQRKSDKKKQGEYRDKAIGIFKQAVNQENGFEVSEKIDEERITKNLSKKDFDDYNECMRLSGIHFNLQWSCKILLNSIYGCLASDYSKFYGEELASSVTLTGQQITKKNGELINNFFNDDFWKLSIVKNNFEVNENIGDVDALLYQDTDSCYITFNTTMNKLNVPEDDKNRMKITKFLAKITLKQLEEFNKTFLKNNFNAENSIFWDQELIARTGLWSKPKKYVCHILEEDGKPPKDDMLKKGLDIVRSSIPRKFKTKITEAVDMMLKERTKQDIDEFILNVYRDFKTWTTQEIAIPSSCNSLNVYSKTNYLTPRKGAPQHMKGAVFYNQMIDYYKLLDYEHIKERDKFSLLFIQKNPKYPIDVFGYKTKIPKEFEIDEYVDWDAHFERGFIKPLHQLFETMKWRFPETKNARKDIDDLFE